VTVTSESETLTTPGEDDLCPEPGCGAALVQDRHRPRGILRCPISDHHPDPNRAIVTRTPEGTLVWTPIAGLLSA
jgi:hypothetical protein